ncbi:MAG: DUF1501 domain-containing protein [Verrucomicrobiales bacterium]|nr:DUF1501 domain-containing protein [Verrucomicrobiales bacterium]
MLTIFDGDRSMNRRELLRIGTLGLGGSGLLGLPELLSATENGFTTGKSVIFLFQQGGPSQQEMYDPKPDGPASSRTMTGTVSTSIPGVHFGEYLPKLAGMAHKLSVVRSYQTNNAGHNIRPLVGPESKEANIGAHYARLVGSMNPETLVPTNMVLFPQAVDETVTKGSARGNLASTGEYSSRFTPFIPGTGGQLQKDLELALPRERFLEDRKALLAKLDDLSRKMDSDAGIGAMSELQAQATQVLLSGGISKALDLGEEDPRVVARFDTSKFATMKKWQHKKRGQAGLYHGHNATLGKLLLQARRLCEAGCGFVTVHASYAGVWDFHADGNNLSPREGMEALGPAFDHAVAALIEDIEARGLQDKILLVVSGEMGRNPKVNKRGGRDHWSRLAPLMLYGGGYEPGQVIGASDKPGGEPATESFTPGHLISTILRTVFDAGKLRIDADTPPAVTELIGHEPITGFG